MHVSRSRVLSTAGTRSGARVRFGPMMDKRRLAISCWRGGFTGGASCGRTHPDGAWPRPLLAARSSPGSGIARWRDAGRFFAHPRCSAGCRRARPSSNNGDSDVTPCRSWRTEALRPLGGSRRRSLRRCSTRGSWPGSRERWRPPPPTPGRPRSVPALAGRPRLMSTLQPVSPGVSGGVTATGLLASFGWSVADRVRLRRRSARAAATNPSARSCRGIRGLRRRRSSIASSARSCRRRVTALFAAPRPSSPATAVAPRPFACAAHRGATTTWSISLPLPPGPPPPPPCSTSDPGEQRRSERFLRAPSRRGFLAERVAAQLVNV